MIFKKFLEYTSTNDKAVIPFNDNELKYLDSKGNLYHKSKSNNSADYYFNCLRIEKISSGKYYLPELEIICTTIQSLVKYTDNFIKELSDWFDNILISSEKKSSHNDKVVDFYDDNGLWGTLYITSNIFEVRGSYWDYMEKEFKKKSISISSIFSKVQMFITYRLSQILGLENYYCKIK